MGSLVNQATQMTMKNEARMFSTTTICTLYKHTRTLTAVVQPKMQLSNKQRKSCSNRSPRNS